MKSKLLVLALLVSASAMSAELPVSKPDASCTGFQTESEAATAALTLAYSYGGVDEFGGGIFQTADNLYCFTTPVGNGDDSGFAVKVMKPKGSKLTAIYHTHPKNANDWFFSSNDLLTAKQLGVHSYVLVVSTKTIITYKTGDTTVAAYNVTHDVAETGRANALQVARGDLVAKL